MTNGIIRRLFRMFSGALIGYMWGWIWGWSLFDPNSDIWALAAGVGAIVGLVFGIVASKGRYDTMLLSITIGLYLSWVARTFLFGDIPGGWGALLMAGETVLGGAIGLYLNRQANPALLSGLTGALYFGFFGGFFVDVIIMDKIMGWMRTHSILTQATAVILCGIAGGIVISQWGSRRMRTSK
ncbi:MAG: hypothetical protein WBM17_17030 [Anaerolineales bacterium]